tara:strand:+ start:115 stop:510 length:396 start_codon:yes stop_codon:yes gene_type:complete
MKYTNKLFKISEVTKIIELINPVSKKPQNHVLRYWEKEFKQIKSRKINNIRYYSHQQVELIKMIKFLLKNKGMTISGVKNQLNKNINKLDDYNFDSLKAGYYKENFKKKSNLLLEKINRIKKYGKKNSSQS